MFKLMKRLRNLYKKKNWQKKLNEWKSKQLKTEKIISNNSWEFEGGKWPQTFFEMIET